MGQGAYILGCAGPALSPDEAAFFRDANPLGFILFARNVEHPDQVRRLTGDLRASVGRDAMILIDQEGGRVQRMGPPHWRQWSPPLDFVARHGPERAMWLRGQLIAAELAAVGIDVNCGPTLDVARDDTHPFLKNRCYGSDPDTAIAAGRAFAQGLMAGGVLPVIKHMPGHGRGRVDSHLDLPSTDASMETLRAADFAPFRALNDLPLGMTAHMIYAALDDQRPATQSPAVIRHIREEIGFEELLMTDDISMEALGGPVAARGARALAAGCDVVLHCNGKMAEMIALADRAGALTEAAEQRAARAIARRPEPMPLDLAAAEAELEEMTKAEAHA